ncbi:MAG: TOBE domain-containing protein [bacterium]|jgi:molybdate transport system regulatory protein|nr:TOBE domain-containing protein [bacterium]
MKPGARNQIRAKVTSVTRGEVMSLVKFEAEAPAAMASVLTSESVDELALQVGDRVTLLVKAVHVMPVKE